MMPHEIDLTKPIKVGYDCLDECGSHYFICDTRAMMRDHERGRYKGDDKETEAYRQLFEEAPRTKLEHGKMLAMLKRIEAYLNGTNWDEGMMDAMRSDPALHPPDINAPKFQPLIDLIDEIEGKAAANGWRKATSEEERKVRNVEGGFLGPSCTLFISTTKPHYARIVYFDGHVAEGPIQYVDGTTSTGFAERPYTDLDGYDKDRDDKFREKLEGMDK